MRQPETISPGMRGFLVTCFRNQESRCISEFYDFIGKVTASIKLYSLFNSKVLGDQAEASEVDPSRADMDFESALKSEIKDIKMKKQIVLAIRNDVKGVVFFKAATDLDVDAIFEKLIEMVISKNWKPKYLY